MPTINIYQLLLSVVALILSIILHEVAHGYVAYKLGDPTAKRAHRLTLNPLAHIDLFGSIILPLFLVLSHSQVLFGWAKPVPFNPAYFKEPRKGIMLVGAAGPATNFALAVVCGALLRAAPLIPDLLTLFLIFMCVTNVVLGVFNLIPIPPLDGSRVVLGLLPDDWVEPYQRLERFGILIIFGLLWVGVLGWIIDPIITLMMRLLV
ncbi:MAG: site-2 protease family protein [Lentisphaerae bacterium]|nr:site-2 protease family protein [Lentisphaerota bacterium]